MKLELEREGVHLEICSVNDWIYFPFPTCVEEGGNRWTQEEKGGECGTGDGWGTDGVGGKQRGESARMVGKFSTWPWVEMKICIHHGAARFWGASFFLSVTLVPQSLVGHPSSPVHPRRSAEPESRFSRGDSCCRRTSALCSSPVMVMAGEKCGQTQYPKWVGMW